MQGANRAKYVTLSDEIEGCRGEIAQLIAANRDRSYIHVRRTAI